MSKDEGEIPSDPVAERLVIGSILKDSTIMQVLAEADLQVGHFYDNDCRKVYEAAYELARVGVPADFVTLSNRICTAHKMTRQEAFDLLGAFEEDAGKSVIHYARLILDAAMRRNTVAFGHSLVEDGLSGSSGPELLAMVDQWLTIQQAQQALEDVQHGPRPLANFGPFEPQGWLIDQAIPYGYPSSWVAPAGSAKSFMSLDLAIRIALGHDEWLDQPISEDAKGRPVLYSDYELSARVSQPRALKVANAITGQPILPDTLHYLPARDERLPLSQWAKKLPGWVKKHNYAFVVLDSLSVAMDEDPSDAKTIIALLNRSMAFLSDYNCGLLILDHPPKPTTGSKDVNDARGAYGTSAKRWLARSIFMLSGTREHCAQNEKRMTFRHTKSNFGVEMEPFGAMIKWVEHPGDSPYPKVFVESCEAETDEEGAQSPDMAGKILSYLVSLRGVSATNEEIANETGLSRASLTTILSRLQTSNLAVRPARGTWKASERALKLYAPDIAQQESDAWEQAALP